MVISIILVIIALLEEELTAAAAVVVYDDEGTVDERGGAVGRGRRFLKELARCWRLTLVIVGYSEITLGVVSRLTMVATGCTSTDAK